MDPSQFMEKLRTGMEGSKDDNLYKQMRTSNTNIQETRAALNEACNVQGTYSVERIEKLIEVPEVQVVERIKEVPQKVVRTKLVQVPIYEKVERTVPVPVVEYIEKVVHVPQIHYQDVIVEKIVEVPERETTIVSRQVEVPIKVNIQTVQPIQCPIEQEVKRNIPIPIHLDRVHGFEMPKLKPKYKDVKVPIYVPRYIEVPIPSQFMGDELKNFTKSDNQLCMNEIPPTENNQFQHTTKLAGLHQKNTETDHSEYEHQNIDNVCKGFDDQMKSTSNENLVTT